MAIYAYPDEVTVMDRIDLAQDNSRLIFPRTVVDADIWMIEFEQ